MFHGLKTALINVWKRPNKKSLLKVWLFLTAFLFFLENVQTTYAKEEEKVIRVGALEGNSFISDDDGIYHGYGVEYLEEIAEYTGWTYEYVFDSWENCINMFENGEVDILCNVQKTEARRGRYLFSRIPFGYDYSIIYAHPESDIYYEDYEAMKGKTVGLLTVGIHTDSFLAYAEKLELNNEIKYYPLEDEVIDAIMRGEVDLGVTGSIYKRPDMKAVGRFGTNPYYIVMQPSNANLMEELDAAMQHIKVENPGIEASLAEKYYGDTQISSSPLFTKEEQEYILGSGPITVQLMEEIRPLSYTDNGMPRGVFVHYLDLLSQKSGLQFEIEISPEVANSGSVSDRTNSGPTLTLQEALTADAFQIEQSQSLSNPLLEIPLSYIKRQEDIADTGRDDYVFAVTNEMKYFERLVKETSPKHVVKYYDSPEACLDALLQGEVDIVAQNSYVISYLIQKPVYTKKLIEFPGFECLNKFCLAAPKTEETLINIINKAINYISGPEETGIITAELLVEPYAFSFADILYRSWKSILAIVLLLLLLVATYTILMRRMTKLEFQKKEYELLQKKIKLDELTGVYNRPAFYKEAKRMIEQSTQKMCIVLMDISNFKVVNDLYGIQVGDKLLVHMAEELTKLGKGKELIIGRFNSDHYYMCMTEADFLSMNFPKRFKTFLEDIDVTVIYGVYQVKDKEIPINIMCDRASLAAHDADHKRAEYIRYYTEEERSKLLKEQEIINNVEKALEEHQFTVYIQPKYNIYENKIIGGEALVRWIHPQNGMISPGDFIPILEKNGFITQLDYYVWEETCRFMSGLKKQGYTNIPISINVSRAHFYGKELLDKLEELIGKYQLSPGDIELEITETICAEDPDIIYRKVEDLQRYGFKIAMDDFGSGYSSLNMLKEMPLDILKMDLRFLSGDETKEQQEKSRHILRTLISLAHSMHLYVIMEGVETESQIDFLKEAGCACAQGFVYSRPIAASAFEEMLSAQK